MKQIAHTITTPKITNEEQFYNYIKKEALEPLKMTMPQITPREF